MYRPGQTVSTPLSSLQLILLEDYTKVNLKVTQLLILRPFFPEDSQLIHLLNNVKKNALNFYFLFGSR